MRYVSSHDVAKAFGRYQDEALAEQPVVVTRYGRPTVVIVGYGEYERLRSGQARPPQREALRAEDIPDDLVRAIEAAEPPSEAAQLDDELGGG